jgi:hypothetical protein
VARRDLEYAITGDERDLKRSLRAVDKGLADSGKSAQRFGSVAKAGFAAAGIGALAFGKQAASAAIEAEKTQARLKAQLQALNIEYDEHEATINRSIAATSRLSGLDDEDLTDSFTNIVRVTGDVNESLRLNALAADFARAKQIDVAKAGEIVAKVAGGNTGILSRYGITLKDGATASEALAALQEKFAGQAKAYGETTAGSMDRIKVSAENVAEVAGSKLAPHIEDAATAISDFIGEMETGEGAGGEFAETAGEVAAVLKDIGGFLKDHPGLIATAAGAWTAYKVMSLAALTSIKVRHFRAAFGVGRGAAVAEGAIAGRAYSTAFGTAANTGVRRWSGGRGARVFANVGRGLGILAAAGIAAEVEKKLADLLPGSNNNARMRGGVPTAQEIAGGTGTGGRSPIELIGNILGIGDGDPPRGTPLGRSVVGRAPGARGTARASNSGIVALGRWLQSQGFHVSEHPAFGGVRYRHAHYPPHDHYSGGALDVNHDQGNEMGALDVLAGQLQAAGWRVIWRTTDHYDHLHVDTSNGVGRIPGGPGSRGGGAVGGGGAGGGGSGSGSTRPARPARPPRNPLPADKRGRFTAPNRAVGGREPLVSPRSKTPSAFEQQTALAELRLAEAGEDYGKQVSALELERNAISKQAAAVRKALDRRGLSGARQMKLRKELAGILTRAGQLDTQIGEARNLSRGLNADGSSQAQALEQIAQPTELDWINAALAEAGLTTETSDDTAALTRLRDHWQGKLGESRAANDPFGIAEAAGNLKQATDSLGSIVDDTKRLAEALEANTAESKQMREYATANGHIIAAEALRVLADSTSGEIAGRMRERSMQPGNPGLMSHW